MTHTPNPGKRYTMYRQCHLRRTAPDGTIYHTIGFIPEKFAVPGKRLKITIENTTFSDWEVLGAGTELFPENLLVHQSQDYKRMRKASDI